MTFVKTFAYEYMKCIIHYFIFQLAHPRHTIPPMPVVRYKMKDDQVKLEEGNDTRSATTAPRLNILTYVLVTMFGTGSWVAMNGIWVELPNLINQVPEKWTLPSYLSVICQLANIGPIVYSLLNKYIQGE